MEGNSRGGWLDTVGPRGESCRLVAGELGVRDIRETSWQLTRSHQTGEWLAHKGPSSQNHNIFQNPKFHRLGSARVSKEAKMPSQVKALAKAVGGIFES